MQFKMLVSVLETVNIPDLPPELMQVLAKHCGLIRLRHTHYNGHADLFVEVYDAHLFHGKGAAMWDELNNLNIPSLTKKTPWIQLISQEADRVYSRWILEMKQRFPGQIID